MIYINIGIFLDRFHKSGELPVAILAETYSVDKRLLFGYKNTNCQFTNLTSNIRKKIHFKNL